MRFRMMTGTLIAAALAGAGLAAAANTDATDAGIAEKVAHEVRMYSRYTIWDNVSVRVENGRVELLGKGLEVGLVELLEAEADGDRLGCSRGATGG